MATSQPTDVARIELSPTPPFDFAQSLAFVRGFAPCADDHGTAEGVLTTGGYADGTPVVVALQAGEGTNLVGSVSWPAAAGDIDAVVSHLRGYLSLEDDLGPLYRTARTEDPEFETVVEALAGYHHVCFPTPFEAACWAALSQRTPPQVARSLKDALVDAAGERAVHDGDEIPLFPTPERVLANEAAVADAISHDRKRKTVLSAARAFVADDLGSLPGDDLRARLADVWGFGSWSSEFVALRGFGRMDRLPATEDRLREVVATVYGLEEPAEDDALDRLAAPYEPLAGYWAHYLRVYAHRFDDRV
jgi:DNA-3-methyladenine glycosylase II